MVLFYVIIFYFRLYSLLCFGTRFFEVALTTRGSHRSHEKRAAFLFDPLATTLLPWLTKRDAQGSRRNDGEASMLSQVHLSFFTELSQQDILSFIY